MTNRLGVKALGGVVPGALLVFLMAGATPALAAAKNYQPIRVDLGVEVPWTPSLGAAGFGLVLDGKYLITDNIGVGLRLTGNVQLGASVGENSASASAIAGASYLLKGEYYLGNAGVRPFAGLGIGLYSIASASSSETADSASASGGGGTFFGLMPQIGVNFGILRLAAAYNVLFGASTEAAVSVTSDGATTVQQVSHSRNFFEFELSFRIGGARRAPMATVPPPAPASEAAPMTPAASTSTDSTATSSDMSSGSSASGTSATPAPSAQPAQ